MFDQNAPFEDQWNRSNAQTIPDFDATIDPWSRGNLGTWSNTTDLSDPARMVNDFSSANNGLFWFWDIAEDGNNM